MLPLRSKNPTPLRLAIPLLSSALLAACAGSSSGSSTGTALNEGSYTVEDFGYTDTQPAGFHPLGSTGFRALEREELFAFMPMGTHDSTEGWMTEGPDASFDEVPGIAGIMGTNGSLRGAAAGNLDQDAEEELVGVVYNADESGLSVRIANRMPDGSFEATDLTTIPFPGWSVSHARVTLADIDGDSRDEIIIAAREVRFETPANRGAVWVLDDPQDGAGLLLAEYRSSRHRNIWGMPADVNGDGRKEVIVALEGDTTGDTRFAVRLFELPEGADQMVRLHSWEYLSRDLSYNHCRAVVGDFNQDGRDDLAWAGFDQTSTAKVKIRLFEYQANNTWSDFAEWSLISFTPTSDTRAAHWDVASYEPVAGQSELVVAYTANNRWNYTTLAYDGGLDSWSHQTQNLPHHGIRRSIRLQGSDVDSDGVEEILVGIYTPGSGSSILHTGVIETGDTPSQDWQPARSVAP
ncbi:MAG: VCBS repeat-containing protein, partial [Planctomycetota bacterium]|nr:VCBS repeat-containing protein [Planctomycetota bacterium]